MHIQAREIRHTVLLFLIVAIVPLIFFPSDLGLKFGMSLPFYLLLELIYFGTVIAVFLDWRSMKDVIASSFVCLGARLACGIAFGILVMLMNGVNPITAAGAGLWNYKPAVLLHTLTVPFIMLSLIRTYLDSRNKKTRKISITPVTDKPSDPPDPSESASSIDEMSRVSSQAKPGIVIGRVKSDLSDSPRFSFDSAVNHVFELSAVKFAILFSEEGLPVSYAGDETVLRDVWAPIGRLLGERVQESLLKAGDFVLQGFDLSLDTFRLHCVLVADMWLLVGADRQSEELEKVRISQSVEMIKRAYDQRYSRSGHKVVPEESYV